MNTTRRRSRPALLPSLVRTLLVVSGAALFGYGVYLSAFLESFDVAIVAAVHRNGFDVTATRYLSVISGPALVALGATIPGGRVGWTVPPVAFQGAQRALVGWGALGVLLSPWLLFADYLLVAVGSFFGGAVAIFTGFLWWFIRDPTGS